MLGQISDIFDEETWRLIFWVGWGSPAATMLAVCLLIAITSRPVRRKALRFCAKAAFAVVIYYVLVGLSVMAVSLYDNPSGVWLIFLVLLYYGLLLAGPLLSVGIAVAGIIVALIPKRLAGRAFPVEPGDSSNTGGSGRP